MFILTKIVFINLIEYKKYRIKNPASAGSSIFKFEIEYSFVSQ